MTGRADRSYRRPMTEHVDVLIVGAGLSGIGSASRLRKELPEKSIAILEAREAIGGTWVLFRYPGVRSDTDMFALGYDFEPWGSNLAIAEGADILAYVRDTARKYGVDELVRFQHRAVAASWSSAEARWTVTVEHPGGTSQITCSLLWTNTGYYRHAEGYTPDFAGMDSFEGTIIHPQAWPEEFDYTGKRVVVIGSGATAITLIPAMADQVEHITMLQRSPTYVITMPRMSWASGPLHLLLPKERADLATKWYHWGLVQFSYTASKRWPNVVRRALRLAAKLQLPRGYDVDTHFNPRYKPWDQRLCLVPDGDFFRVIRRGQASIVTDTIERFTPTGIALESGERLEADVIITATGFSLEWAGGMTFEVDGEPIRIADTVTYKGLMLSGIPNYVLSGGYTNASFTLKVNLTGDYVVRLLRHLDETGDQIVMPLAPPEDAVVPWMDLSSGYIQRSVDEIFKAGAIEPWAIYQNYPKDVRLLRKGPLVDDGLRFSRATAMAND